MCVCDSGRFGAFIVRLVFAWKKTWRRKTEKNYTDTTRFFANSNTHKARTVPRTQKLLFCLTDYFVLPIESTHFPTHKHIYIKAKADFNKYIGHNYTHTFVHATFIPLTFTHLQKKKKKINISSHFCLCCFRCFLHIYARNVFHSERGTKSKIKRISNIYKCIFWKNIYLLCTYYTYI